MLKRLRNIGIIAVLFFIVFTQCASIGSVISKVPGFQNYKNNKDMDAEAVSKPGFIGKGVRKRLIKTGQNNIACTVDVIDPKPDKILDYNETVIFVVTIRNFSIDNEINPKMEISSYINGNPQMLKILFLNPLHPGEKTEFRENVSWDKNIAGKLIKYKFRVFDKITNSFSLVMEKEIISAK